MSSLTIYINDNRQILDMTEFLHDLMTEMWRTQNLDDQP